MPEMDGAKAMSAGLSSATGKQDGQLTVLSESDSLSGRLVMKGDGQLLGGFQGEVDCAGELLVGKDARVEATIVTKNITISGSVQGSLTATGRLKITATGRLEGDARVGALIVQEGGVHQGAIGVHPEGLPARDGLEPVRNLPRPAAEAVPGDGALPITSSVDRVKKMLGEFF
ncbi:MAG: bactofilin family protein [Candidatus Dormibacteraceae bacterium]